MVSRGVLIVASLLASACAISYHAPEHATPASKTVKAKPATAAAPKLNAAEAQENVPVMVVEEEVPVMELVPVPVMQVVVVQGESPEDGFKDDGFEYAGQPQEFGASHEAAEPQQHSVDEACQKEMITLQSNNAQLLKAQKCEDDGKTMEKVVSALKLGNLDEALAVTEQTFQTCSAISAGCAKQIAPSTVQKLRLSGMAVTEKCAAQVEGSKPDTGGVCMKNMTSKTVEALKVHDLDLAMQSAQHGMDSCMGVSHPCDFQFAPMVTMQIAQIVMEQMMQKEMMREAQAAQKAPVVEVLLNGLKQMKQVSKNMTAAEEKKQKACEAAMVAEAERASKEVQDIMKDVEGRMDKLEQHFQKVEHRTALRKEQLKDSAKQNAKPVTVAQKKKALSLLSLQDGLKLSFRKHRVAL